MKVGLLRTEGLLYYEPGLASAGLCVAVGAALSCPYAGFVFLRVREFREIFVIFQEVRGPFPYSAIYKS